MATRVVKDGESDLPRDVFELDKDERWQARLDEARARREIALREKAAGKPPKKRLKPWEVEADVAEKPIEPVIQARDSDRVDFADRVDTMRQVTSKNNPAPEDPFSKPEKLSKLEKRSEKESLPKSHNWARLVEPDFPPKPEPAAETAEPAAAPPPIEAYKPPSPDEFDNILTTLARPRSAKKATNLVLPDAPGVKELAERYAATLEPETTLEVLDVQEEVVADDPEPDVVATAPEPARNRRPLLLASTALLLAMVPFIAEAPPIEKGPPMPPAVAFAFQPALGVTWSLQEVPVPTRSGEWAPRASWSPVPPMQPVTGQPAEYAKEIAELPAPAFGETFEGMPWTGVSPVRIGAGSRLFVPQGVPGSGTDVAQTGTVMTKLGQIERPPLQPDAEKLPDFGNAPTSSRPPLVRPTEPDAVPEEASFVPPPRLPERPLKITILRPAQTDEKIAATIAEDVTKLGHELVRIQSVNHSISERNLRYFFASDRSEAQRLADEYDAELRDFTWFRPRPDTGTAELWLTGKPGAQNPVVAARPRVQRTTALTPPAPQQVLPAPTPQIVEPRKSLFERIFLNHQRSGVTPNLSDGDSFAGTQSSGTSTDADGTGNGTANGGGNSGADTGSDTGGSDSGSDTGGSDSGGDSGSTGGGGNGNGNGNGKT